MSEIAVLYEGSLFNTLGGGGQHLVGLATAIDAVGADVHIIVPRPSELDTGNLRTAKLAAPGPLPFRLAIYEVVKTVEVLRQAYRRRGQRTVFLTRLSASAMAVRVARLSGFRVVTEVNGPISDELAGRAGITGTIMSKLSRWLETRQLRDSEFVVCVAPALQEYVRRMHPDADIRVLSNGAREPSVDRCGDRPPPARIAYLGAISHWYDLGLVQDAVAELPDGSRFDVVGDGTGLGALRSSKSAATTLHGWLPPDAANELLAQCHVGVIPCREETDSAALRSPLKLYHYLSMGLVPVVADVVDLDDAVLPYVITYETGDVDSLRKALTEALTVDVQSRRVPPEVWSWKSRAEEFVSWIR